MTQQVQAEQELRREHDFLESLVETAPVIVLVFLERSLGDVSVPSISEYGGNYVSFMLLGVVITTFSATSLNAFSRSLRSAQVTGTLEVLLFTKARLPVLIVGLSLYPFVRESLRMLRSSGSSAPRIAARVRPSTTSTVGSWRRRSRIQSQARSKSRREAAARLGPLPCSGSDPRGAWRDIGE